MEQEPKQLTDMEARQLRLNTHDQTESETGDILQECKARTIMGRAANETQIKIVWQEKRRAKNSQEKEAKC